MANKNEFAIVSSDHHKCVLSVVAGPPSTFFSCVLCHEGLSWLYLSVYTYAAEGHTTEW